MQKFKKTKNKDSLSNVHIEHEAIFACKLIENYENWEDSGHHEFSN